MLTTTSRLVLANASSLPHGADPTRDCDARCLAAAGHGHDGSHRLSASRSQAAPGRSRPCRYCCAVFSPMSLRKTSNWTSWESQSAPREALSCPRVVKGHAPTELRHWNGGRDPPQPPSGTPTGKTRKKKVRRMVANDGAYWTDRLTGLALAFSRVFFFFFLSHPLTTSISALPWGGPCQNWGRFLPSAINNFFLDRRLAAASSGRRVAVRRSALCLAPLPRCVNGR